MLNLNLVQVFIQKKEELGVGRAVGKIRHHVKSRGRCMNCMVWSLSTSQSLSPPHRPAPWACDTQELMLDLMLCCCHSEILIYLFIFGLVGPYFPDQGPNLSPLQWKHGVLTIGPTGKPTILKFSFYFGMCVFKWNLMRYRSTPSGSRNGCPVWAHWSLMPGFARLRQHWLPLDSRACQHKYEVSVLCLRPRKGLCWQPPEAPFSL